MSRFSMKMCSILAVSALSISAPAALAAEDKVESKTVCKREAKTGTRFPKKICRSQAEWERISEQSKRDAKDMIDRPQIETRRGS